MARACVINVAGLSGRLLAGGGATRLTALADGGAMAAMVPILPAVTCSMQATLTTGKPVSTHGIVANGTMDRRLGRVSFWEQSARMVGATRVWDRMTPRPKTAMLFWQNSMIAADVILSPKPVHGPGGKMTSWCYDRPAGLYAALAEKLGPFPLHNYWGPMAGAASSEWITTASLEVWHSQSPDLMLVYVPHLDYDLQRFGPLGPQADAALAVVDELVGRLIDGLGDATVLVVGEYAMTSVTGAVHPNRVLRAAGLLEVYEAGGGEYIDFAASEAFAMVDHQIAHVYCNDQRSVERATEAFAAVDGIHDILDRDAQVAVGINHPTGGDLVLVAEPDRWFTYYHWTDDAKAPPFARTVDIHNKPGYDPVELFFDPATKTIPLDASLVKGSHGGVPATPADRPVVIASDASLLGGRSQIAATDFAPLLATALPGEES